MDVSARPQIGRYFRFQWRMILFIIVYSTIVWYVDRHIVDVSVPVGIAAVLGTAISILLGFRTNAAYDRWWEARKV